MAATKAQKAAAARARANRHPKKQLQSLDTPSEIVVDLPCPSPVPPSSIPRSPISIDDSDEDLDECGYNGGVNVECESIYEPSDNESEYSDTESLAELDGNELEDNLVALRHELQELAVPTPYEEILRKRSAKEWATAESGNRGMGYNGLSGRTERRRAQQARKGEAQRAEAKKS